MYAQGCHWIQNSPPFPQVTLILSLPWPGKQYFSKMKKSENIVAIQKWSYGKILAEETSP
jgi:hypothetical protein